MLLRVKTSLIISLIVFLQACGGTSGTSKSAASGTNTTPGALIAQTLSFQKTGPINAFVRSAFINIATGEGSGAITYTSSDNSIASVNSVGTVTVQKVGAVTISSTIAKDDTYSSSSASYSLNAILEPISLQKGLAITASVGDQVKNAVIGGGTGVITYISSDTDVATVGSEGLVSVLKAGSVIITSNIEADSLYPAGTIDYSITTDVQPFVFMQAGPLSGIIGDQITNPATGGGLGDVTYQSSNTAIATVNNAGEVNFIAEGHVDITAAIAADANYPAEQITYSLTSIDGVFEINAWVGNDSSEINFSKPLNGFELYLSSQSNCDIANYNSCLDGSLNILNGLSNDVFTSTAFRLDQTAYATFKYGDNSKRRSLSRTQPNLSTLHKLVYFQQKLWLYTTANENNIWTSSDGMDWQQQGTSSLFSGFVTPQIVEFNNKLYAVGGGAVSGNNDVWSSDDGLIWSQITADAGFPARGLHQVVVFLDKLWVIGGSDGENGIQDVWSSSDAENWTQQTIVDGFTTRAGHQIVVFAGKLWFLAGIESDDVFTKDVWSSIDGINWVQETDDAAFSERGLHTVVAFNDKLWLFGGIRNNESLNDIWSSADGTNWVQERSTSDISENLMTQVISSGSHLWHVGGNADTQDDVWKSSDGENWQLRFKLPVDL